MKSLLHIGLFLFFGLYSLMAQPFFEVQPTNNAPEGFDRLFSKQVEIFGVSIFATTKTPDYKFWLVINTDRIVDLSFLVLIATR